MRRAAMTPLVALAFAACAASTSVTVKDQRGRRIVDLDRPVMATEFHGGRRVFWIDRDAIPDGPAGFALAIEVEDLTPGFKPNWEREFIIPESNVKVFLVVSGDAGRPFWSREAQGNIRVRQFDDRTNLSVDLSFKGKPLDAALKLPIFTTKDDVDRVRVAGSFTVGFDASKAVAK